MGNENTGKSKRLLSLDVLRGLDMFLLTVIGPFVWALDKSFGLPKGVLAQFDHAWGGFTLWDIIMPLFIFMSGAAVPFAMKGRLEDGHARGRFCCSSGATRFSPISARKCSSQFSWRLERCLRRDSRMSSATGRGLFRRGSLLPRFFSPY